MTNSGIRISITELGEIKGITQAERINGSIKNGILRACKSHSIDEAEETIKRAVDFYNNERPHMSFGMRTLADASKSTGKRVLKWKSYREHNTNKNMSIFVQPGTAT